MNSGEPGPDRSDALDAALREIGRHARATNRARAKTLSDLFTGADAGQLTRDQLQGAADLAHQIAGSAGTFGYRRGSALAAQAERLLSTPDLKSELKDELRSLVLELAEVLAAEPNY